MSEDDLFRSCRRLNGNPRGSLASLFADMAGYCATHDVEPDMYGRGGVVEALELDVARRLGKPAAVMMPSGTMAQQIALRVWAERAGHRHVAMHPTAHLELHEHRGYAHLHGLRATLVGPRHGVVLARHLDQVPERLAALLVELPVREAGGLLPTWEELEALKAAAAARGVALHLDGARLWEAQPWFARPHAAICEGFDSVYVSLYKGIGGLCGAVLAGQEDFVDEARVWLRRHGGNVVTQAPAAVSALLHLDDRLARMPAHLERARAIAAAFTAHPGITVVPDPPQAPMMHLHFAHAPETVAAARDAVARSHQLWLFGGPRATPVGCTTELAIGDHALDLPMETLREALGAFALALDTHAAPGCPAISR